MVGVQFQPNPRNPPRCYLCKKEIKNKEGIKVICSGTRMNPAHMKCNFEEFKE